MKTLQRKKKFLIGGLAGAVGQSTGVYAGKGLGNDKPKFDTAGAIGAGTGMLSAGIDAFSDGQPSVAGSATKGALQGVTAGAAFGPIGMVAGGLLGGVAGGISSWMEKDSIEKQKKAAEKALIDSRNLTDTNSGKLATLNAGKVGVGVNEFDKGGKIQKGKPLNILSKPILLPNQIPIRNPRPTLALNGGGVGKENEKNVTLRPTQYLDGGKLKQLSSDTQLAEGNTHEQGGIDLTENSEIENQETVKDKGDSYMIMSNNLINPKSGNTFAKDDSKLAKQAGKLEGSKKTSSINGLKLINRKRDMLENMQQIMNGNSQGQNI